MSFFIMKKITKSDKIFIRREKASIRRQFSDAKKQQEAIAGIYAKFNVKPVTIDKK